MVLIALLVAQVMLLGHQREVLQDAAIEAAAFGALADQSASAAIDRASDLAPNAQSQVEVLESKILKVTLREQNLVAIEVYGYAVLENQR